MHLTDFQAWTALHALRVAVGAYERDAETTRASGAFALAEQFDRQARDAQIVADALAAELE